MLFPSESIMFFHQGSLRSKRFQSSYYAKVITRRFFCSCPSFLDEPREETLATQAIIRVAKGYSVTRNESQIICEMRDRAQISRVRSDWAYLLFLLYGA